MLKEKMYVRCPIEEDSNPRFFALGRIKAIDDFSETAVVEFFENKRLAEFFTKPEERTYALDSIKHCRIRNGASVLYDKNMHVVKSYKKNDRNGYYDYFLLTSDNDVIQVPETKVKCCYNNFVVNPKTQALSYEFQNPMWFLGRSVVSKTMHIIDNSLYGFKELAGCKIQLKPYQLKTVIRCLQTEPCRNMIADEVGLGKTVEAIAVLKIFLRERQNTKVLIVVPDALEEQWKTELAFKFRLFEGENINGNTITFCAFSNIKKITSNANYDFVIVDEVHCLIFDEELYEKILLLSKSTKNILMLSATPIQKRKEEYQKLLTLIQPTKYECMPREQFDKILDLQSVVIRKIHDSLECLDSYIEEIEASENNHTNDTKDAFDDLIECLDAVSKTVASDYFDKMLEKVVYEAEDFSVGLIQTALSYICEYYQLEKTIIRNRRSTTGDTFCKRILKTLPYEMGTDFNATEYQLLKELSSWLKSGEISKEQFESNFLNLLKALFSSASAFSSAIGSMNDDSTPESIVNLSKRWSEEEESAVDNIKKLLEDPERYNSRLVNIVDFIDQETEGKKVLVFTDNENTFELYRRLLTKYFGEDKCCFFSKNMDSTDLELNVYRFQNKHDYRILLSDKSGGEGRNFQNADYVLHIDLPWNANNLEQRIGRLDRIGRKSGKPICSVVTYAIESPEEDLFKIWNEALHIFTESQSGLEIIMNDIDQQILDAVYENIQYGLNEIVPDIIELVEDLTLIVKKERYFDLAAYQYLTINKVLEQTINRYTTSEKNLFGDAMMGWASLAGFIGDRVGDDLVSFSEKSFSIKSAYNSFLIPPNMKVIFDNKINQMQNRVRLLNHEASKQLSTHYIVGTFNREYAVENDYIHFYAPGDDIFNCITDNAMSSYKGTCAAIGVKDSPITWKGFIFTWQIEPNEMELLSNGINVHKLNQYRGFLPPEQYISAVGIDGSNDVDENEVIKVYKGLLTSKNNNRLIHLGKRKGQNPPIDVFKHMYPKEKWEDIVETCYKASGESVLEKANKRIDQYAKLLVRELSAASSNTEAMRSYYGNIDDTNEFETAQNQLIIKAFRTPNLVLDSMCYILMEQ